MFENLPELLTPELLSFLVAVAIGLAVGLERELNAQPEFQHFAGIRTMPLIATLGAAIMVVSKELSVWVAVFAFPAFLFFVTVAYYVKSRSGSLAIKHEVAMLLVFISGGLCGLFLFREALLIMVITMMVLSFKERFQNITSRITQDELFAFVKFAVLCFVIIPFLPAGEYGPEGLINPREVGIVVVLVSGLSFIGYILTKFGKPEKGILLTAVLGGLSSSTAITWSYSRRSKEDPVNRSLYAAGILIACSIMLIRIFIFTLLFSPKLAVLLAAPLGVILAASSISALVVYRHHSRARQTTTFTPGNPIDLGSAIWFGLFFMLIKLMVYYGELYFGKEGLWISGLLSGITDVDAITINVSKYSVTGASRPVSYATVILIAALSNSMIKWLISHFRSDHSNRKSLAAAFGAIIVAGVGAILVLNWT